jgi:propanol-preferring alcohol dehydrogenase
VIADAAFAFPLDGFDDPVATAPLLCAGLIGWRSLKLAREGRKIGLYGFGAAAHIIAQVCRWQGRDVYAFTRPGDSAAQELALSLGACWVGGSEDTPPERLDAAILCAPVGALVPAALGAVRKGGRVVCGGIHMSDIPQFPYRLLWEERQILSVANLTRQDATEFLELAPRARVRTTTTVYALERANEALADLRAGRFASGVDTGLRGHQQLAMLRQFLAVHFRIRRQRMPDATICAVRVPLPHPSSRMRSPGRGARRASTPAPSAGTNAACRA